MSVRMGAFLLADAGLLDGVEATTHTRVLRACGEPPRSARW